MKLKYCQIAAASILSISLIFSAIGNSQAGSLAGSKGDVRFPPTVGAGECNDGYKAYIAASGHSAYATTFYSRVVDLYIICGTKLNAASQKAAEEMAMRNCQAGLTRWKLKTASGGCAISASK
ncbi:hypothetical protein EN829_019250 [Mesorhizobium sp. M00.F.Ca.ET.186.01.1.1]|nr:hypothetical protein EN848_21750 [bacterium M00.F.Ca.ET.205.01.1.1]TGU50889.1 hypothetical protein EN795_21295 [bacterium M00.F.Ca.ET.152.01.1.1]TGV34379.1 hypothetical protein EN829_019250 [Mesorhizobium sp. M00.F.Ca.ET.186.01.1.1]TGZ41952.1 hypothetical protein EN805_16800 [bacterium M00.F.Ca.ET.162.01.1.1]